MRRGARVAFTLSGWGPEVTEGSYTEEAVYGEAPHRERLAKHETGISGAVQQSSV
jgi:hypothetical protein